jgi:hypothetical protein
LLTFVFIQQGTFFSRFRPSYISRTSFKLHEDAPKDRQYTRFDSVISPPPGSVISINTQGVIENVGATGRVNSTGAMLFDLEGQRPPRRPSRPVGVRHPSTMTLHGSAFGEDELYDWSFSGLEILGVTFIAMVLAVAFMFSYWHHEGVWWDSYTGEPFA